MSATSFRERFQEICIPYQELQPGKELGGGSFGTVRLGNYQHMDVAIKELTVKKLPEKAQEEFEQEALVMKDLRHRNVVLLYGVCIDPRNCLVMEYCAHGSLYHLLQSHKEISEPKRLQWAAEIAKGLSYLHNRKSPILHRDLKSLNVLIDEHSCAKIADFGLSKVKVSSSSTSTLKGKMVGTVRWMAPEIMEAEKGTIYTKAADVYSYGMVAWELATRTIPYEHIEKEMPFMMKILQGKRQEIPPNTSPSLQQVITGCWKQTPEERLSLDKVIQTLNTATSNPPSPEYPPYISVEESTNRDSYGPFKTPVSQTTVPDTPTIPAMAFGKAKWAKYFGDIGAEPPLPPDIEKILDSECIFWPGKKVRDTHLLVLIPNQVNGKAFHLNSLKELIQHPKTGHKTDYELYNDEVRKELGKKSEGSHWVLMTRDVIPNSLKGYNDQKALVASHASRSKIPYVLPTSLDAATAILMEHVQTGSRLYPGDPLTYTRCQEEADKNQRSAIIGGFVAGGLGVSNDWYDYDSWCDSYCGVGCCQRF